MQNEYVFIYSIPSCFPYNKLVKKLGNKKITNTQKNPVINEKNNVDKNIDFALLYFLFST